MGRETHLGNCDLGPSLLNVSRFPGRYQHADVVLCQHPFIPPTSQALPFPSSLALQSMVPSYSRGYLAPVFWAHHPPDHPPPEPLSPEVGLHVLTSLASLTFIVLPGGDAEEAQDVYCGVCPAWRRASVHCGCVREVAGWVWGLPAPLPGRPHTSLQPCAFHLISSPMAPHLRAGARGVELQYMGTARAMYCFLGGHPRV